MVKLQKKSPKAATPQAKKVKAQPVKVVEEEESDSEEEEEEEEAMEVQLFSFMAQAPMTEGKVIAEVDDDEDEDSDDEEEEDDDDDDDDDSDEEEEEDSEESEAAGQNGKTVASKPDEEEEDSDEDDDEDDDDEEDVDDEEDEEEESDEEEEETLVPLAATKRKAETKAAVPAKKAKAEEDDEDDEEEDEESEDEDEDESDDDEEEEDSDDEEEEEDEEEETPQLGKRKAKGAVKEESPAKKVKVEGEQSTLFVGNLTEKITEEKLRKFFKKKGLEVLEMRYLTKSSGKSLAYVDIPAAEEATGLGLNGASLAGTELKVEKAKSKIKEPKSPGQTQNIGGDNKAARDAKTLFLRNLSYDSTKESIMEVFTDAVDVRIPTFKDSGRPKGIAFVEFESEAKAEEVKSSMDGVEVDGRSVGMDYCGSKATYLGKAQAESPEKPATPSKTLVIKNLSYNTTAEGLKGAFEGSTDARVIMKPGTERSRGFGYVDFESEDAAGEALDKLNQSELDGRTINVEFSHSRRGGSEGGSFGAPAQASKTLIVKNLSYDTSEEELQEAFEGCLSTRIITDRESGRPKGFGYIDFDSEDAAKEALKSMDQQELGGRNIRLDFALPRGEGGGRDTERLRQVPPAWLCTCSQVEKYGFVASGARGLTEGFGTVVVEAAVVAAGVVAEVVSEAVADVAADVVAAFEGVAAVGVVVVVEEGVEGEEGIEGEEGFEVEEGVEVDWRSFVMDYKKPGWGSDAPVTPSKTLVVRNLSYNTTTEGLMEAFAGCLDARVIMKPGTDRSRGFGYVDFESEDAAEEALDKLDQSDLDGRTINVEFGTSRGDRGGGGGGGGRSYRSPSQATKTLIVKNLSYDTGEEELQDAFEGCLSARIVTQRESGRSKGFGYVDFDSEDAAQAALNSMDQAELGGRNIRLDFALPRGEGGGGGQGSRSWSTEQTEQNEFSNSRGAGGGYNAPQQPTKTLIVMNLSYDTGEEELQDAFEGCLSARIVTHRESGRPKGFGYVDFDSEDAAQAALKNMDQVELGGRNIRLDFALPRGEGGGGRGGFRGGRGRGGRGGRGRGRGGGRGGFQ
ncbi:NCL [Branchiostoma lanceolatum]|uniref:NCL protein n=1 Tax=Branchiostoma lanceolatum TaxID=7740 RepID=A0A8J9VI66_BRALA|nr:NCL [Branchiostoma lanceolatum]